MRRIKPEPDSRFRHFRAVARSRARAVAEAKQRDAQVGAADDAATVSEESDVADKHKQS